MKVRLILIPVLGIALTLTTFKTKYQSDLFIALFWFLLAAAGCITVLISLWLDIRDYMREPIFSKFTASVMALAFGLVVWFSEYCVNYEFNKPSLLRVYYDGDITAPQ